MLVATFALVLTRTSLLSDLDRGGDWLMETNPPTDEGARAASVDALQECLRWELSAVATHERALASAPLDALHRTLQDILMSHVRRTAQLGDRLRHLGSTPESSAEPWAAFLTAAGAGGEAGRAEIGALQDGERRGVALYSANVAACDLWTRTLLAAELRPEQRRTLDLSWRLQRYVEAAG
jgi:hypothetical protein